MLTVLRRFSILMTMVAEYYILGYKYLYICLFIVYMNISVSNLFIYLNLKCRFQKHSFLGSAVLCILDGTLLALLIH